MNLLEKLKAYNNNGFGQPPRTEIVRSERPLPVDLSQIEHLGVPIGDRETKEMANQLRSSIVALRKGEKVEKENFLRKRAGMRPREDKGELEAANFALQNLSRQIELVDVAHEGHVVKLKRG